MNLVKAATPVKILKTSKSIGSCENSERKKDLLMTKHVSSEDKSIAGEINPTLTRKQFEEIKCTASQPTLD